MRKLQDKVAFVTGGASGIGHAIARAAAQQGAKLAIADIQGDALAEAVHDIEERGGEAIGIKLDVRDRPAVYRAADQVEERFGRVDLVFNNAGIGDAGTPLDRVSDEFFDWIVHVNLFGVMNILKAFVPKIRKHQQGGHIVNTSSMAGLVLMPGWNQGLYSATKMAVLALSLDLREALKGERIGVSALCPGLVETNIARNAVALRPPGLKDAIHPFPEELTKAGMPPDKLAEIVFSGIEQDRPIIVTHPEFWPAVHQFHEVIRAAFRDQPASAPFSPLQRSKEGR